MKFFTRFVQSALAVLLIAFLFLAFTGCDHEVTPELKKVIDTYEITFKNSTYAISFNYNDKGIVESMVNVEDLNHPSVFTYKNNQLTEISSGGVKDIYMYDGDGNLIERSHYIDDNGDGVVGLYNKYLYSYNANNQVVKQEEIYYYEKGIPDAWSNFTLYQYANIDSKNPISSEYYVEIDGDGGSLYRKSTFIFDDKINPFYKTGVNLLTKDFATGFGPNNLIHTGVTGQNGNGSISTENTYDEDGYLTNSIYTIIREGVTEYDFSVTFTYKEI